MTTILADNLFGENHERLAIERLKLYQPPEGYYVAFSGGKDSVVILNLCKKAGVKHDAHYSLTTIDPPELVKFIRTNHPEVEMVRPQKPLLQKMMTAGFPTRWSRWCCEYLKEDSSKGRTTVTGVRRAESVRRKTRAVVELNQRSGVRLVNPIVDWTTAEIWEYIHGYNLPYCSLYDEGFERLGCVLCPMTSTETALMEIERWPKIAEAWRRGFRRLYDDRKRKNLDCISAWNNGDEMFEWWLTVGREGNPNKGSDCQGSLFL